MVDIAVEATAPDPANRTLSEGFRGCAITRKNHERQGTENIFSKLVDWVREPLRTVFACTRRTQSSGLPTRRPGRHLEPRDRFISKVLDRTCDLSMYPLVNVYSLRTGKWPSRNSGFTQLENGGSFHSYVNVYQRVIPMISLVHYYIPILPPSEGNKSIQKSSFFLQPNVSLPEGISH